MDLLGLIIGGIFGFIFLLILGYVYISNPGYLLVTAGVLLGLGILVRAVIQNTTRQDSPWED